ncbi:MAG TPA: molybdopterin dinucleotide binding domain-containing protein, partial [Hyphomicrobium sp.]|nr:molybdopterin dinucleotide binding domain-containing protein [Hyphomicrobium sp.]
EFQVHCDPFMNPTAQFADIVLPVSSPWERESLRVGFEITQSAEELIQLRQTMVAPTGESRSDMRIVFDLACRLGLGEAFFQGDIDAAWNHVLEPVGVTVDELRRRPEGIRKPLTQEHKKYRRSGFATETGRVEVYSELFLRHGHPPVPVYVEPAETPGGAYPLVLTTGNRGNFRHSQDRGIVSLRRRSPYPEVIVHPEAARAKGLEMGGWAALRTRFGAARMRVRIDDTVHPRVVVADYGFWQECPDLGLPGSRPGNPLGGNYNNMITSQASDPVSGALALRSFACDLEPSSEGAWPDFRPFVVRSRSEEADGIVTLDLIPLDGSTVPAFHPGQHITVRIAHAVRSYSLSSGAQDSPRGYQITVKRDGEVSRIINDDVRAGDVIEARAPAGHFVIPRQNEFPVVLVAAGIGITPFISYLRSLTGSPDEPRVVLHYCDRDQAQRAFTEELSAIEKRLSNLSVVHHLTRPRSGDLHDRAGRVGADDISGDLIDARARFYLCGPVPMMESLTRGLLARGVMRFEIFKEQFQAANASVDAEAGPFEVRFARSGKSVVWTPRSGTILDCAERAGIALPAGCRVGQCESCSLAIVDGKVRHLVELADPESESCLTCQAIPRSNLILDA